VLHTAAAALRAAPRLFAPPRGRLLHGARVSARGAAMSAPVPRDQAFYRFSVRAVRATAARARDGCAALSATRR
jgi:hypothetical protein